VAEVFVVECRTLVFCLELPPLFIENVSSCWESYCWFFLVNDRAALADLDCLALLPLFDTSLPSLPTFGSYESS
jgi:hypothetical protein